MAKKDAAPAPRPAGFCAYIGPSIYGVIQAGTIYPGNFYEARRQAADAIKKYPLIEKLIIPGEQLPDVKAKFAAGGSYLNIIYQRLIKEAAK